MSVLCSDVCRLYVLNVGMSFIKKIAPDQSSRICLIRRQNSRYFRCRVWKTKSW